MSNSQPEGFSEAEQAIHIGDIPVTSPNIGYGTYHLGDKLDAADTIESFRRAHEAGITLFDTSDNYGTELAIGRAVSAEVLPRNEVIIATKTGLGTTAEQQMRWREEGHQGDTTPERIRNQVDRSLLVLGDDVGIIDLYQLHVPDERVAHEAHAETMSELIEAEKIREYGLSNYSVAQLEAFLEACDDRGLRRPAATQPFVNMLSPSQLVEVELAHDEGLTVLAHSPLVKGVLTNKRLPEIMTALSHEVEEAEAIDQPPAPIIVQLIETVGLLQGIASEAETTSHNLAQAAIAWLATRESTVVLAAVTKPEYLADALVGARWQIDDGVQEKIEDLHSQPDFEQSGGVLHSLIRQIRRY